MPQLRRDAFLTELRQLLARYDAELMVEDHYLGYPECGSDVRVTAILGGVYDGGRTVHSYEEIDLGHTFSPNQTQGDKEP